MKEKLKGFYEDHKEAIDYAVTLVGGLAIGYVCGRGIGSVISTGFKDSYNTGLKLGYNKGCDTMMDWLFTENSNNPDVLLAVAECVAKHTK